MVLFVTFLDNTIVATALSSIQTDLHAGVTALQWVVSSYALVFASLMLTFGTLSDRLGRRLVMVLGLVVFTAGSILGAVATSPAMLIGGRVVMGIGAAASEPGTLSMIRQLWPDRSERARALGVWVAVSSLALAAGPVAGGALVGLWSWRAVFVFNVFAGVIAIAGVLAILPEPPVLARRRLDLAGFSLGAAAIVAATFATIFGETYGYGSWWIALLYAAAASALVCFVVVERKAEEPVLDVRFFRTGVFSAGNMLAFTGYFATFSVFFFIPLFLELVGTSTSYRIAVDFLPMALAMIAAAALAGRWVGRGGPALPMLVGCALAGSGILLTDSLLTPSSGPSLFGWSLAMVGAGLGVAMVAATSAVLGAVPAARSGMAASTVNTSRQLGAVTGVAVLGAIVDGQLTHALIHKLAKIPYAYQFRSEVITAITTGTINTQASKLPKTGEIGEIVKEVEAAARSTFAHGVDLVMLLAGATMLASALAGFAMARRARGTVLDGQ
jgi:EmrB/QacA subfamily drug resistance transporter